MVIDKDLILRAKDTLGDRNADIIAEKLGLADYDSKSRKAKCPVHREDTASFIYNPKAHNFHCFGCGCNVDIIDAYIKCGKTYIEAVEQLFSEAGIPYSFAERGVHSSADYKYPKPEYAGSKDKVYEYWKKRCISPETIDYLGIEQDKQGNTLFRYYDLNDVFTMCKVRISGKAAKGQTKCWCLPGSDTSHLLYNMNKVNVNQPLIITSGEGDCATAIECGFYNTVSICLGDSNTQYLASCWDFLQNFNEIILVHDNDASGEKFAKNLATRLGEYRVKIVDIPPFYEKEDGTKVKIKDLNELLFSCGKEAVVKAINEAQSTEINTVIDYSDVKEFDMSDVDGFTTGFRDMDSAIDKFYMGTTTILTGIAGAGKSTMLSTLACQSIEQGYPCFVYSGELSNMLLKNWIESVHAGQRGMDKFEGVSKDYYRVNPTISKEIRSYYKEQLWFYKDGFDQKISTLLSTMESIVRKHGVKTIIIDNMSSVDLENDDNNKYIKQDEFIRNVIEFSKKWQVCCILVLHPRKMDMVRRMSIFDLQGCVSAVNLAHRVISLYRVQPREKEADVRNGKLIRAGIKYDVICDVLKDRFGSGTGREIGLYYDIPSRRFYDSVASLDFKYAWDKRDYGNTPLPYGAYSLNKAEQDEAEVFGTING